MVGDRMDARLHRMAEVIMDGQRLPTVAAETIAVPCQRTAAEVTAAAGLRRMAELAVDAPMVVEAATAEDTFPVEAEGISPEAVVVATAVGARAVDTASS
jgi:hypothetical protein